MLKLISVIELSLLLYDCCGYGLLCYTCLFVVLSKATSRLKEKEVGCRSEKWVIIREDVQEVAVTAEAMIDTIAATEADRITTIRVMSLGEIGTVAGVIGAIMTTSRDEEEAIPVILPQKDVLKHLLTLIGKMLQIMVKETHSKSSWKHH